MKTGTFAIIGLTAAIGLIALAACARSAADTSGPAEPGNGQTPSLGMVTEEFRKAIEASRVELAGRSGIAADKFDLYNSEPAEWGDTSLGKPEEGHMYAQVITPGFRLFFAAEGKSYTVHSNADGSSVVFAGTGELPGNYQAGTTMY